MRLLKSICVVVSVVLFTGVFDGAHAAAVFTETWTTPGNTQGWLIGALAPAAGTGASVSGGVVNWTADTIASFGFLSGFQAQGQPTVSGGNFSGNYTAAGINALSFDFALDSDSLNDTGSPTVRILFTSSVGGFNSYWLHDFSSVPIGDGFHHFVIPMQASDWTQFLGTAAFSDAIQNVQTVEVDYFRLGNFPAYSQTGRFDNFATLASVPEPFMVGPCAVVVGFGLMRRRSK